ncbi:16S rRNA (cytidine(1402)-2'-O)-methyltransferase [Bacillaceae bacterium SIJ1]|uniref:16S rRNA (cytidine(1402)-2'-O)-methyltransferase n=1 Tax=Litoribacterium kuwaitense TaxID=1398745 RepID=UPI0013EBADF0|nr:16S rRNA (cytidine(1402)-2'-O)-methyltransferase [Litoribacterium kuwaitense]NGP45787.1 16S rRNA (cytidine(1402)-2'-O)-methyltransferase [Litoribacterium kuwaitense]
MDILQQGTLYLVATPIGNLEDMTFRAVRILSEVDVIAAEDTRVTQKLCRHYEIRTPLTSYHEHNKEESGQVLLERIKEGENVALVSDAGTPAVSDPGYELVVAAVREGIPVVPIPGANAAITALIASASPTDSFGFVGFLPRKSKEKKDRMKEVAAWGMTWVFYESPHRVKDTLTALNETFSECQVTVARELTKKFETFHRGTPTELLQYFDEHAPRGECCFVVNGCVASAKEDELWWEGLSIYDHVKTYVAKGETDKTAIKRAAVDRQMAKREVYGAYHVTTSKYLKIIKKNNT